MATVESVASAQSALQEEKAQETNQMIKEESPKQAEDETVDNHEEETAVTGEEAKDEDVKDEETKNDEERQVEEAKMALEELALEKKVAPEPDETELKEPKKEEEVAEVEEPKKDEIVKDDANVAPAATTDDAPVDATDAATIVAVSTDAAVVPVDDDDA